jgi:cytoskeletal protein RodZ
MNSDSSLGAYLRRRRERSGLSVEAVSAGSRIVPRLVEALEGDRHDLLPAPVYVRGFIRAYCQQVGGGADYALRLYDALAVPDPPVTAAPSSAPARTSPAGRRWRRVAAGALLVAALGVAAVLVLGRRQPDAAAGRGTGGIVAASGSTAAPAAPGSPGSPAPSPLAGASTASEPVDRVLVMRATDTTWVRVQPDGAPPTEDTLSPGAVREWRSTGRFRVTLGNAGGVQLELDGRALPALGAPGQVVRDVTVPGEPPP